MSQQKPEMVETKPNAKPDPEVRRHEHIHQQRDLVRAKIEEEKRQRKAQQADKLAQQPKLEQKP